MIILMEKKPLIRILLSITVMLASWSVDAHQPVLNSESRTPLKRPTLLRSPKSPRQFTPNSRGNHITTESTVIRDSNFTQASQYPRSMIAQFQKSFPSKSLMRTSDW